MLWPLEDRIFGGWGGAKCSLYAIRVMGSDLFFAMNVMKTYFCETCLILEFWKFASLLIHSNQP